MNFENTDFLIRVNEKFSTKYSKSPKNRTLNELFEKGYVNLDKDAGPTSHIVTDNLKKVLDIKRAGHSGTLDPNVTGVLLIGLGKATKLMEYMLKSNKEYVCHMYVHKEVSKEKILESFNKFTGVIKQLPPIISAIKRQLREREIYSLELLDYQKNGQDILFRVACQHGTYIRKLCTDIGIFLGVGAQMKELRRTKAGPIREEDNIISLDELRNLYELYKENENFRNENKDKICPYEIEIRKYIRPMEDLIVELKKVIVRDSAVDSITRGSDLAIPGVHSLEDNIVMGDEVAMYTGLGELIGVGVAYLNSIDVMKKNKGAFIMTNKTFMEPGIYPKIWNFNE